MHAMVTRCPKCSTAFKITDKLLASAKGAVRCGSCLHVFNAREHLITPPASKTLEAAPQSTPTTEAQTDATPSPAFTPAETNTVPAERVEPTVGDEFDDLDIDDDFLIHDDLDEEFFNDDDELLIDDDLDLDDDTTTTSFTPKTAAKENRFSDTDDFIIDDDTGFDDSDEELVDFIIDDDIESEDSKEDRTDVVINNDLERSAIEEDDINYIIDDTPEEAAPDEDSVDYIIDDDIELTTPENDHSETDDSFYHDDATLDKTPDHSSAIAEKGDPSVTDDFTFDADIQLDIDDEPVSNETASTTSDDNPYGLSDDFLFSEETAPASKTEIETEHNFDDLFGSSDDDYLASDNAALSNEEFDTDSTDLTNDDDLYRIDTEFTLSDEPDTQTEEEDDSDTFSIADELGTDNEEEDSFFVDEDNELLFGDEDDIVINDDEIAKAGIDDDNDDDTLIDDDTRTDDGALIDDNDQEDYALITDDEPDFFFNDLNPELDKLERDTSRSRFTGDDLGDGDKDDESWAQAMLDEMENEDREEHTKALFGDENEKPAATPLTSQAPDNPFSASEPLSNLDTRADDLAPEFLEAFSAMDKRPAEEEPAPKIDYSSLNLADDDSASQKPAKTTSLRADPEDRNGYHDENQDNDKYRLLKNIEPEPVEMDWIKVSRDWPRTLLWSALSILAAVVLAAQIAWYKFDHWSRVDPYRSYYESACNLIGCQVPARIDTSKIKVSNLVIRSHPNVGNALTVDAILLNHAGYPQPFPDLVISFSDINGKMVAARRFTPDEYLTGELAGRSKIPYNQPVHLTLDIADPGRNAVNYQAYIPQITP